MITLPPNPRCPLPIVTPVITPPSIQKNEPKAVPIHKQSVGREGHETRGRVLIRVSAVDLPLRALRGLGLFLVIVLALLFLTLEGGHVVVILIILVVTTGEAFAAAELREVEVAKVAYVGQLAIYSFSSRGQGHELM